jgi:hypothetical protein
MSARAAMQRSRTAETAAMTHEPGRTGNSLARRLRTASVFICAACFAVSATAATPQQRAFGSADEAATALVQAVKGGNRPAVLAILGTSADKWIGSGDAVADRAAGERFVTAFEQKHGIDAVDDAHSTLTIGSDDWPFAFPLVKTNGAWRFDTEAGKTEMLARRIGENELAAIKVLLGIVDAQREYASADRNRDGVREYARRFASSSGKKDGLYWPTSGGEPPSPLGPLVVRAAGEGYAKGDSARPYHGYNFRPLLGQGKHAPGGSLDYIVQGHMIGGFASLAYPARYGSSGVMTFIVNHDGVVYQKDLGPDTVKLARAITRFDPDTSWTKLDHN